MNPNSTPKSTIWAPQDVDFVFLSYQIYEQRLADILKVLPLVSENEKSWSPELVNLFLDIASLIDSVSRHIVGQGRDKNDLVQVRNVDGITVSRKVKNLKINDFEANLFSTEHIIETRVVVYKYPLKIIKPYDGYRNGWWNTYNLLKHNRVVHYNKANLVNTLNALGALFLILVKYKDKEFTKALLRFDLLKTNYVPEFVHDHRLREPFQFWYDSELFGTHELVENIPSDDISRIQPVTGSRKLHVFIGRYNP